MTVRVEIHNRVLWVGGEAYPLRNISHVGQRRVDVDKSAAWKRFFRRTLGCVFVGAILATFSDTLGGLFLITVMALLIGQLISVINQPPLFGLVVNTSGTQRVAVWSTDQHEINQLIHEITKAIGHPDVAQAIINVAHAVQGDYIQQYGAGSIGKAQHGGAGDIMAGR